MANVNVTSDAWTEISITSGTVQNISATADIELSAEQTDNSGVVLKPSEIYQWDNETIYARAVTEDTGALRVVNFKRAAGGGGGYVLPVASASTLGGVKVGGGLDINASGVLSAPVVYSTTEQVIGTWVDGKPLYKITYQCTTPANAETNDTVQDISALDIEALVSFDGIIIDGSSNSFPLNIHQGTNNVSTWRSVALGIRMNVSTNITSKPCFITLQYTKTTD